MEIHRDRQVYSRHRTQNDKQGIFPFHSLDPEARPPDKPAVDNKPGLTWCPGKTGEEGDRSEQTDPQRPNSLPI